MRGALVFSHIRDRSLVLPTVESIIVPCWGCVISDNVLSANKTQVNPNIMVDAFRGFVTKIGEYTAQWPGGSPPITSSDWFQRGWVISGNSSVDFMTDDGGGPYGNCVVLIPVTGAGVGFTGVAIVDGNIAGDNDGLDTGWDELGGTGTNVNLSPRGF